jgi:hypothetical protein
MKRARVIALLLSLPTFAAAPIAQGTRIASPPGMASTEIRGKYKGGSDEPEYEGGKWIEVTYGRPIKRGRDLWGSGADYGKMLNAGAPVWRAGANVTTRLKTELPLVIGGKTVAPGEYSVFIDLKPGNWTFIVSSWAARDATAGRRSVDVGVHRHVRCGRQADHHVGQDDGQRAVYSGTVTFLPWSLVLRP